MKLTILYDNEVFVDGLKAKWGFSCLIEKDGKKILFDTGGNSPILLQNMEKLNIDPIEIDIIFISHSHWDHIGGLSDLIQVNSRAVIYTSFQLDKEAELPATYLNILKNISRDNKIVVLEESEKITDNIYSTGRLINNEQSLIIKTERGLVLIVGCSHPGIEQILAAASKYGDVYALVGGFHGFKDFKLLEGIELICPTHCTQYKEDIILLYPDNTISGGVGKEIDI